MAVGTLDRGWGTPGGRGALSHLQLPSCRASQGARVLGPRGRELDPSFGMEASRPGIPATQPAGPGKARGAQATSHGLLGTDQPLKAEAAPRSVLFAPGSGSAGGPAAGWQ